MHYSWKCASKPEFHPEKLGLKLKMGDPKQDSNWKCSHMSLPWLFYAQIQIFSVFLSHFSSKCHFAAGHESSAVMCACLQFLSVQSGQCYKDDHIDLTKQSHPPATDTARQLVKAQQGQIFQTLDTSFPNHFSQDIFVKFQANVLPKSVFWWKGWFALKSFFLLWIILIIESLLWALTKVLKSILFSWSHHRPTDQRPHSEECWPCLGSAVCSGPLYYVDALSLDPDKA